MGDCGAQDGVAPSQRGCAAPMLHVAQFIRKLPPSSPSSVLVFEY
jgi:hypothetical protein